MTRDIDVFMPPADRELILELADRVAREQGLPRGEHAWLNDAVSFFGLKTKSSNVVFSHPNLIIYSADWHELLGMKLSGAWRREVDVDDAVHILRRIGSGDKDGTLALARKYKNLTPHTDDATFAQRFERTWQVAFSTR